jgi:D-3-phosphoglycerate dehydrogenase
VLQYRYFINEERKYGKMSKIVIMESLGISAEELAARKKPFEEKGHTFACFPRTTDIPTLIEEAKDADAMIIANMPMPGEVIASCENLKFIDVAFTGVDHVGLAAAKEKGIAVSNASGYSNEAVSELVLGMVLNLLRNMSAVEARCREGKTFAGLMGSELKGKTVGIIGLGKIGSRSAELFHAFGCRVLANSRTKKENAAPYIEQVSKDELLRESDIVVLHCPLNDSTRGMINAEKLALMKKSAILINVARGPVVVAKDLAEALDNGTIAAAGVDVFDKEPPLDLDEPLLHCRNCLVTPHVAFASEESMTLRAEIVFDNLDAWMRGEQKNVIL